MFIYDKYISIVKDFVADGYKISSFMGEYSADGCLFLRHDIDCDPLLAWKMANIEASNGFSSTYFFQIDSDFYPLFSSETIQIVLDIVRLGHSLGLHISPGSCRDLEELRVKVQSSFEYLSKIKLPFSPLFSFHRPASFWGWRSLEIPGLINVYSREFCDDIAYISDSNRRIFWESNEFLALRKKPNLKSVQLLTHPLWWSNTGLSATEVGLLLESRQIGRVKQAFRDNIKIFKDIYPVLEIEAGDPVDQG